jgi:hypothetical protein
MKQIFKFGSIRLRGCLLAVAAVSLMSLGRQGCAQTLYSYVNENGIRVLTNIPPKNAVAPVSPPEEMPTQMAPPDAPVVPAARSATRYDALIEKYASEYQLDPSLVRSIIATESAFNPRAISRKGARGLMQLMPATASRLGVRNLHDAEENIKGGTKYLRSLMDTFDNNLTLSLAAYNAGENLVQRIGRIPDIAETHTYVRMVQKRYGKKEMTLLPQTEEKRPAPAFWYTDGNGVLHLTNIIPVERPNQDASSWASGSQDSR